MPNYISEADASTYFALKLNVDAWDDASSSDRVKALTMSTSAIDRLNYLGEKSDSSQVNQFPRDEDSTIPTDIEAACAELAYAFLDGVDPELEFENLRMVSQGYSNVRSTYDRSMAARHIVVGIVSVTAWRFLQSYLRDFAAIDMPRVS